ncbi:HlyD family efflux transporter periplasmic adaptor subunit [Henriciella mobilis]|uniref:efflux RND transporter periplasmic adaptor subunit n=1 Tax=Henriciella mobilis TaxID=2305467 RepID=UPI000E665763|nr:HlyD family efflux transporter periplasmic adaptor subunit [Henriciella mobilis]RIJ15773.1 HlyD family efflux transporter periplasmic adaptor subunit [Henriciella mobilis]RIJ20161.1 HlyD family efflux transporter periplasmic adaptor subunit [Henriciella mobilis]
MKIQIYAIAVFGLSFMAAPIAAGQTAQHIELTDQQMSRLGITLDTALAAENAILAELPARAIPARSELTVVSAPYEGTVLSVSALPGQSVSRGDTLFVVSSRDYVQDRSGLEQARAEYHVAKAARERQERLVAEGIAARSSLDEAVGRERTALAMVAEHERSTPSFVQAGSQGSYIVKASIGGTISKVNVGVGDNVAAMSALLILNGSDDLWVDVQVPVRLIAEVTQEDLIIYPSGGAGEILSIQKVIDPRSRAGSLIATVPTGESVIQGQLFTVQVARHTPSDSLVIVPSSAVVNIAGVDRVFRRTDGGFSLVDVNVSGATKEAKTLRSRILPGDKLATRGLVELKAIALQEMN